MDHPKGRISSNNSLSNPTSAKMMSDDFSSDDPINDCEHRLQIAQGYYELQMYSDARRELREVELDYPREPSVLQMKILLVLKEERWEDALTLSEQLRSLAPEGGASFIHGAFCLHELDRTLEAVELLLDGPDSLQDEPIYHYNLGCYKAAIGALEDARKSLRRSFNLDERLVDVARKDPDLKLLQDLL